MNTDVPSGARAAAWFEKVSKVYANSCRSRRVTALDGVSFGVGYGEVFGLVGPNRSGKTTLVKVLLSICRPTDGRSVGIDPSLPISVGAVGYAQTYSVGKRKSIVRDHGVHGPNDIAPYPRGFTQNRRCNSRWRKASLLTTR